MFEVNTKSRVFQLRAKTQVFSARAMHLFLIVVKAEYNNWIKELKRHTMLQEENEVKPCRRSLAVMRLQVKKVLDELQGLLETIEQSKRLTHRRCQ